MNHFSIELSLFTVIPALVLCGYIFYKDRIEKEPFGLLSILFVAGAIGYIPCFFAQQGITSLFDSIYKSSISFSPEGLVTFATRANEFTHHALIAFFGYALPQIAFKWCLLYFITHKNKNFNYLFDGVVYATFLSLGFAIAENVHFVIENDWALFGAKILTSIPCHLFIGILIGYYYTMWHARFTANSIENQMLEAGIVKEDNVRSSFPWLLCSFCFPILVNGIYIFAGSVNSDIVTFIFYLVVFILYGISFVMVDQLADKDRNAARYVSRMISKGHPDLSSQVVENIIKKGCPQANQDDETEGTKQ